MDGRGRWGILADLSVNRTLVVGAVSLTTVREPAGRIAMDTVPPLEVVGFVLVGIVADATVCGDVFSRIHLKVRVSLGNAHGAGRERSRAKRRTGLGKYLQPHWYGLVSSQTCTACPL